MQIRRIGISTLFLASLCLHIAEAATVAVDYGSAFYKAVLVKGGRNVDIVLNRDSKRKTPAVITIRGDERIYGSDAINIVF